LLKKLRAHGINGHLLNWIESWLTGREQRVRQRSLQQPPLLFNFINDLDLAAQLVTLLKKSADDTKLGQIIRNHKDTLNLQAKLNSLMDLEAKWGMAFNGFYIKKRKVMHMGRQNQDSII
jgi:hypothetical protein